MIRAFILNTFWKNQFTQYFLLKLKNFLETLDDKLDTRIGSQGINLSGGQKQRVAIARAIIDKPSILIADEPTGNLDSESGEAIIKLLFELNKKQGATLIIVTHDLDIANRCDRVIELKDGNVVSDRNKK